MTYKNRITGDVLEFPWPNEIGESVILLNGKVIEYVLYSDESRTVITVGDGRSFAAGEEFTSHVLQLVEAQDDEPPW